MERNSRKQSSLREFGVCVVVGKELGIYKVGVDVDKINQKDEEKMNMKKEGKRSAIRGDRREE